MATLLAHIQIHEGMEAQFEAVMREMYRITHATETQCLRYEYWRGQQPGFYYCLLAYQSNQAFWEHQASDHHEGYMGDFAACIKTLKLEVVDPVAGASQLPAASDRAVDASSPGFVQEQARLFPLVLQTWWNHGKS